MRAPDHQAQIDKCMMLEGGAQAGLKPGQRIYEISDPINTNEMLDMRKNPSRQGALRALANRVPQQIFFTVSKSPPDVAQKLIDESGVPSLSLP